ncbi:MAG: hypothetical protein C0407_13940 [Desulfobacca sp.]|nr:hypothetical protein [Desulfobacca sp.]
MVCLPIWEAQGAPDLRNPFTFPAGVLKGEGLQNKEGGGPERPEKEAAPVFRLTTILISGQTKVAAINGMLLRKGEELSGYRIVEIEEKQVTLLRGKEKLVLRLDGEEKVFQKKMESKDRVTGFPK